MKYLALFIIFALALSSNIKATRIKNHNLRTKGNSNLHEFCIGFAAEALPGVDINKCLPKSWKAANTADEGQFSKDMAPTDSFWSKLGKVFVSTIGTAIDAFCLVKDLVKKIETLLIDDEKKKKRRWRRYFLQGKRRNRRDWWDSVTSTVSKEIDSAAANIAKGVTSAYQTLPDAAAAAADWAKKTADEVEASVKKAISGGIQDAYELFVTMRKKWEAFLKSDFYKNLKAFYECYKEVKSAKPHVDKLIKGIGEKLKLIANWPSGFVTLIIGLICAWKDFVPVINYINEGVKASGEKKWNFFGKAVGKFGVTLALC